MMKVMNKRIGLILLAVIVAAGVAQAEVYFDENLDTFSIGRLASSNVTWWTDAATTSGGKATWRFTTGSTVSSMEIVADPGGRSGNSLYFNDWSSAGTQLQILLNENVSEQIRFKYDFFYSTTSPTYNYMTTLVSGNTYNSIYQSAYTAQGATQARYYTNNAGVSELFDNGQWYTVTMDIPERSANAAFTFGVKITKQDGTVVYNNASLPSYSNSEYTNSIMFTNPGAANYSRFYLDNISVETIPEPATMSLVAFGALGMIRRRK